MVPRPALIGSAHCAGRQRDKLVGRTFNAMPSSSEVTTMPSVQCQTNAGQQILRNESSTSTSGMAFTSVEHSLLAVAPQTKMPKLQRRKERKSLRRQGTLM